MNTLICVLLLSPPLITTLPLGLHNSNRDTSKGREIVSSSRNFNIVFEDSARAAGKSKDESWISKIFIDSLVLPIIVAVAAYICVDRLGEWKKRRSYSTLGVAIIESLQEEVRNGIKWMTQTSDNMKNLGASPPNFALSNKSWSGMSTIPDDVLLRILETAKGKFTSFHPRECRIHCKNYFEYMCGNYNRALSEATLLAANGQDWRTPFTPFFGKSGYIEAATGVIQMLEDTKKLLNANSKKWIPR
jgi:hypothetical protein